MTLFWFLCVSMTAVALAFVLLPLWRQTPPSSGVEANALNLQVIRQQLAELEQDLATGALDETQYQSARRDLEKELLLDYAETPRSRAEGRAKPWMAAAIGLFLPAIAFAMYHQLGNPDIISRSAGDTAVSTAMDHGQAQLPSMDQLVERLAQRLAQQPDNLDGWMMLGRSYLAMGRMQDAINAYGQAYKLAPGNVEILLAYAQSLGMAQGNRLQGQPSQLIAQAEKISPEDPNVLWLSGVTSFEQADYPSALAKWEKVLAALEPGSDDAAEVSPPSRMPAHASVLARRRPCRPWERGLRLRRPHPPRLGPKRSFRAPSASGFAWPPSSRPRSFPVIASSSTPAPTTGPACPWPLRVGKSPTCRCRSPWTTARP